MVRKADWAKSSALGHVYIHASREPMRRRCSTSEIREPSTAHSLSLQQIETLVDRGDAETE
jgi:hypothetical protein